MNINEEYKPTDWEDYWDYQSSLSGSFANENFKNAKIEKINNYNDIVKLTDEFISIYPLLSKLLDTVRVTKITSKSNEIFYLLGWSFEYGYFGGLTRELIKEDITGFHKKHNLLLKHFGGFIEEFGELMDTYYLSNGIIWQLSHKEIIEAKSKDYYLNNNYYSGACKQHNVNPVLNLLEDFVQFTEDSDGDFFMYNKHNSEVWMFRHEGYGNGLIKEEYGNDIKLINVDGASEGLFFRLEDCSLVDWVENGAYAWLNCFEKLPFDINKLY